MDPDFVFSFVFKMQIGVESLPKHMELFTKIKTNDIKVYKYYKIKNGSKKVFTVTIFFLNLGHKWKCNMFLRKIWLNVINTKIVLYLQLQRYS